MTRVLVTGGSGFIALHILELLIAQGHSVVTSVRSESKAQLLKKAFPNASKEQLDFVFVQDVAQEGAFDEAVKSDPPFEWVIHTASPFHFNVTDVKKDLLDPAIVGTTGILKAIKKNAPGVKRVVRFPSPPPPHPLQATASCLFADKGIPYLSRVGNNEFLRRALQPVGRPQTRLRV